MQKNQRDEKILRYPRVFSRLQHHRGLEAYAYAYKRTRPSSLTSRVNQQKGTDPRNPGGQIDPVEAIAPVEANRCEIVLVFITAILVVFSSMYVSDSIIPLSGYLPYYYESITDSQIGWLSSISFLPSIFTTLVITPLIDRFGPIQVGFICQGWFLLITGLVLLPYVHRNYHAFLLSRFGFGLLSEQTWLLQSTLIVRYLPRRFEALGFGVCTSLSTVANLVALLVIPTLFTQFTFDASFPSPDEANSLFKSFERKVELVHLTNFLITLLTLLLYLITGLPLLRLDHAFHSSGRKARRTQRNQQTQQTQNQDPFIFVPHLPTYMPEAILPTLPTRPNRISSSFKLRNAIGLSFDYWALAVSISIIMACCDGCQAIILTFLEKNNPKITTHNAETFGIVRSIISLISGPISGLIVGVVGHRPLLNVCASILGALGFLLTLLLRDWANLIPMVLIGFVDGATAGFAKSLVSLTVSQYQLNVAYAIIETLVNTLQFIFPPMAGFASEILFHLCGSFSGIALFYTCLMGCSIIPAIFLLCRDKPAFRGRLSIRLSKL
ncbi:Major Facilitator Superfamily transporter [Giardia muris]|uniref:Lysosomal dipeptide transporter MFSD1 n=1 Tax=Giardia muris TaxID=5742 RepID=A0A4Z1TAI8_GIAMU|nr:Major Facilitator Superfamily transporter [Giardia muris]|eukprot:TNJ29531.1 Major Facilitator Superfamily transporter [Giardia muris]